MARLTEHDDAITPLLRRAPLQDVALGPAPATSQGRPCLKLLCAYEAGTIVSGKWCFDLHVQCCGSCMVSTEFST